MEFIKENIQVINENIERAALNSSRKKEDITLLGVTKTVDTDAILEAINCGITDVGENKPQELARKYDVIGDKVRWHLIGTLQTNKVKYIIDKVSMIHSLDREALCEEIQKRAEKIDKTIDCLVQVNISKEESKHGLDKVMVKIPMAPEASISPSFRYRSSVGFAITWARVTCLPGTNSCIIRFFSSSSIKSAHSS